MKGVSVIFFAVLFFTALNAQNYKEGGYINTIDHKIIIPEDGSVDEVLKVSSEWAELVLKQIPGIKDVRYLLSYSETDTLNLLVLYEYESREDAAKSGQAVNGLIDKNWPDKEARDAFFARFRKYINPTNNVRKPYKEIVTYK